MSKEYGNGNPDTPLALGTAEELAQQVEQELDSSKRSVLKQGIRFARVARRYKTAMLENDPAAIALLERICLFRLGVEAETLAAIFTSQNVKQDSRNAFTKIFNAFITRDENHRRLNRISGKALARLNTKRLQQKLDWLVKMRIIEKTTIKSGKSLATRVLYNIHPAVRDGFFRGIAQDTAIASHQAIREGLEVSLGDAPGENPSEPAILDLLEEIVYHAIACEQVQEAFDIYWNKIGAYKNLLWRLGAYERGERICRTFGGGQSPETVAQLLGEANQSGVELLPCLALTESDRAVFINEWALYLEDLGRLDAAACCYEAHNEMRMLQESWGNASQGNMNLSEVWLLAGRLRLALAKAGEALRLSDRADDASRRWDSYLFQGAAHGQLGVCSDALDDFRNCLHWQHQVDGNDDQLYSNRGIYHTLLLTQLGRHEEAQQLTEANKEISLGIVGHNSYVEPKGNLILANLSLHSGDIPSSRDYYEAAHNWALARDAKEVLCWAALVKARIEINEGRRQPTPNPSQEGEAGGRREENGNKNYNQAQTAIAEGLKLSRDCGYGIYHIDLLLEQAHLHLLQGSPQAALKELCLALDDGIPANEATGQQELLAANHPDCGYAWGITEGLHLRAQALLLQAAQELGRDSFVPARRQSLPAAVQNLITKAQTCLNDALSRWRDLRDPEVKESNFLHPETGEEYNYRAAATYQVLQDLQGGLLTRYPLTATTQPSPSPEPDSTMKHFFISYNGNDRQWAEWIAKTLEDAGYETVIQAWDFRPGGDFVMEMQKAATGTEKTIAVLSDNYLNA